LIVSCVKDRSTLIDRAKSADELNEEASIKKRVDSYLNLAMNAIRKKNYPVAYENLFKAIDLDKKNKDTHNLLGLTYLYDGKEARAIESFKRAIKIDPNYSEAHNHLGIAYSEKENFKKAVEHFEKALDNLTYKTPWIAYTNLGKTFLLMGKQKKAIKALERSLSKNSRQCIPYQLLGEMYLANKNLSDAELNYENTLKYCQNKGIEHFNLGFVYLQGKKYEKSKKELELCIEEAKKVSDSRLVDKCSHYINLLDE
jgi:type IV pilus biogenesis/stability protein PilW